MRILLPRWRAWRRWPSILMKALLVWANVVRNLVANLTAEGPAWGGDKSGKEFEKGYNEQSDFVNKNIDAKRQLLDGYSEGIRTATGNFAQQDES